jgi:predicted DNA-binding transcriptional regulator AlpA
VQPNQAPPPANHPFWLSFSEAAELLGVSVEAFTNLHTSGNIPFVPLLRGEEHKWARSAIQSWKDAGMMTQQQVKEHNAAIRASTRAWRESRRSLSRKATAGKANAANPKKPKDKPLMVENDSSTLPALLTLALICKHFVPYSPRTLRRMISAEQFPKADVSIGSKIRLWKLETVKQWIESAAS